MSPKGILITFAIISLILIGIMFLAVDGRNNHMLDKFSTIEEKFQETNTTSEEKSISLENELKVGENPNLEVVKQFSVKADELLIYIESLKKEFISGKVSDNNFKELEASKNEILFDTLTNAHSEKGKQFILKIKAFEDAVTTVHLAFPKVDAQSFKLRSLTDDKDWLSYNFKDFPMIASYTKLVAMESDIKSKKEIIFNEVLRNE